MKDGISRREARIVTAALARRGPEPRGNRIFVMLTALLVASVSLSVPFVPQVKGTCGAASLAMVLDYWGRPTPHDTIASALLRPDLQGITGSELAEFARWLGMTAVAYRGDRWQLRDYLKKGRPLIVAWKQKRGRFHNVVVTGFDGETILVNDPDEGASRRVSGKTFEKRWAGAGYWTLLVLPVEPEKPRNP